ncbi:MAG: DUF805 domain-containing protein [Pseudomonadota bacterium]
MGTEQAVRRAFLHWSDYKGRANRTEFWQFFAFFAVASLCLGWLANEAVFWVGYNSGSADAVSVALLALWLTFCIPLLAALARRYNDVGIPRIGVAVGLAALVAILIIFIALREQIIAAGLRYTLPISHVLALMLAVLPSSKTSPSNEVPQ